jgi:catalase-peroxidase
MNEETVALIAGGHTFGKVHGAADPEIRGAWTFRSWYWRARTWLESFSYREDTISSGLEGAWVLRLQSGVTITLRIFSDLNGVNQESWRCISGNLRMGQVLVPDAHNPSKSHAPFMLTSDLALRVDPIYEPISRYFYENPWCSRCICFSWCTVIWDQ